MGFFAEQNLKMLGVTLTGSLLLTVVIFYVMQMLIDVGDVELDDTDDLAAWMRHKMEERNAQIEQEDEDRKAADLKERKRKVMDYQQQSKILLKELRFLEMIWRTTLN